MVELSLGSAVRPELVEGSDEMESDICHRRALWPRGASYFLALPKK